LRPNSLDAFLVFVRGDAALDKGEIDLGIGIKWPGLGEMHKIHLPGQTQQFRPHVKQCELAAIARAELVNRDYGLTAVH
jgi:hypothetical protein